MEDIGPTAPPPPSLALDAALLAVFVEEYEGPLDKEGRFTGHGRAVLKGTGSVYEGDFALGSIHGEGTYTWKDGLVYHGGFAENCITGIGNYTWPGGANYSGGVLNGLRHGYGVLHFDDSVVRYEGEWKNGRRHGQGTLWYDDNGTCCYRGSWRDDKRHGVGELRYASGNVYTGEFYRDIKEGKGTMRWRSGSRYTGDWVKGMPHGRGEQVWEPEATSPWPRKEGLSHLQLQNKYVGEFRDGARNGRGTFWYATGAQYIGEWYNNLKHGKGVFTYEDGTEYAGFFEDDRPVARGSPMKLPSRHVRLDLSSLLYPGVGAAAAADAADAADAAAPGEEGGSVVDEVGHVVLNLLLRYNSELRAIYKHYASGLPDDRSLQTLALPQLWLFLHSSRIVTSCLTHADVDELARGIVTAKREPDHAADAHHCTNHLLYREFLELLVHLAHHRYSNLPSLEQRVQRLLTQHVIRHMPAGGAARAGAAAGRPGAEAARAPGAGGAGGSGGGGGRYEAVVRESFVDAGTAGAANRTLLDHFQRCAAAAGGGGGGAEPRSTCTVHDLVRYLIDLGVIGAQAAAGEASARRPTSTEFLGAFLPALYPADADPDADHEEDEGGGARGTSAVFELGSVLTVPEFCAGLEIAARMRGAKSASEMLADQAAAVG